MNRVYLICLSASILYFGGCAVHKPERETVDRDIPPAVATEDHFLWAIKPEINVRAQNHTGSPAIAQLYDGDSVAVIGNRDGWYHIRMTGGDSGFVRSDLLGTRNLSVFSRAPAYADSLSETADIQLFFDKQYHHKRIYAVFPRSFYLDKTRLRQAGSDLIREYQSEVYSGDVVLRILDPDSREEVLTLEQEGEQLADVILPVTPFGRIHSADLDNNRVTLVYRVPETTAGQSALAAARDMAGSYPIGWQAVEITFLEDHSNDCLLWFREDPQGERYSFNECPAVSR